MGPRKEKIEALEKRMAASGIFKKDIEEKFIKASGRGGQKVNKTSSAVFLKHIPTGITVKCSSDRSRHTNRFLAMRRLVEQIESQILVQPSHPSKRSHSSNPSKNSQSSNPSHPGEKNSRMDKISKIRKQKSKRKKRARSKLEP